MNLRGSLVSLLFLSMSMLRCSAEDQEPPPTSLVAVLGIEGRCVESLRRVKLELDSSLLLDTPIQDPTVMPLAVVLQLPRQGPPFRLRATFTTVDPATKVTSGASSLLQETHFEVLIPAGSSGRVTLSAPCVCLGLQCSEGVSCREIPPGSGKASCVATTMCWDGVCSPSEDASICPADCSPQCGDGRCEHEENCPVD
ncbi:MAG: hypothetical protein RMJ98_23135, partial [Myxococcales bacterium]|nr:hypothetical protein [Polyangiaceae bacterium]MDW8252202.1 hypothetical protein [Myxococcales bacterium]